MYLPQGTVLNNRYMIESLLGHGGFGITYAAHDQTLKVRVAIKEYLPRQLATRGEGQTQVSVFSGEARQQYDYGLRKFMEEAQSVARFAHHPNVVSARDYFEANGTAYMVMEYVEGVTLKEYLAKKGGRISFEEAKGIMMPVMDALREVHQAGMLHRDISPDNIYITTSAQVKILDFGAARYFAGEQSKSLSVILKSGYAPEEQYRSSGKQGAWTDVYAVGATLYKAVDRQDPTRCPGPPGGRHPGAALPAGGGHSSGGGASPAPGPGGQCRPAFANHGRVSAGPSGKRRHDRGVAAGRGARAAGAGARLYSGPVPHRVPAPVYGPPRRAVNPAAIAAAIGGGVIGLIVVVVLIMTVILSPAMKDYLGNLLFNPDQAARRQAAEQRQLEARRQEERRRADQDRRERTQQEAQQRQDEEKRREAEQRKTREEQDRREAEQRKVREEQDRQEAGQRKTREEQEGAKKAAMENARALYKSGVAYSNQGQYQKAIAVYLEVVRIRPESFGAYFNMGLAYEKLGQHKEAIEAFKKVTVIKPNHALAHYNLSLAYNVVGEKKLSMDEYIILKKQDQQLASKLLRVISVGNVKN